MTKMTEDMWIAAGFEALKRGSFSSLKADLIAKQQGVTRGSFYGYFGSLEAYHDAILDRWLAQSTELAQSIAGDLPAADQLRALVLAAYNADPLLEKAMRGWAQADPKVASKLDAVDGYRITVLTGLFQGMGLNRDRASVRSRLLYASAIGFAFLGARRTEFTIQDMDQLVSLYTADLSNQSD